MPLRSNKKSQPQMGWQLEAYWSSKPPPLTTLTQDESAISYFLRSPLRK